MKKNLTVISLLSICAALSSCLKDGVKKGTDSGNQQKTDTLDANLLTSSVLSGKWAIVTDSVSTQFWGLWSSKPPVSSVYIGKSGDYYNFGAYGRLAIRQDTTSYTDAYKINRDTILIRYAYIDGQTNQLDSAYNPGYMVSHLTKTTCTLTSFFISPETATTSIVDLKKE
jgi:hypothetical protein